MNIPIELVKRIIKESEDLKAYEEWQYMMNQCIEKVKNAWSRNTDECNDEKWFFWGRSKELQFQAMNCHKCGEYRMCGGYIPIKIACMCYYIM